MKPKLLLPNRFKLVGLLLFIPFLALGFAVYFFDFSLSFLVLSSDGATFVFDRRQDLTDETALTGIIAGLLLIAFAREKQEDEFINKIRLESLQWAVLINYVLLLAATWLVYSVSYLDVMMFNMLTVLVLFILRFHVRIWSNKYSANHQTL